MRGGGSRSRLLELIIDLCVFAVCAVICTLLLLRAQQVSVDSLTLTQAVYRAQTAAETWKATGTIPPSEEPDGEGYLVEITQTGEAVSITVLRDGEPVYAIGEVRRNG